MQHTSLPSTGMIIMKNNLPAPMITTNLQIYFINITAEKNNLWHLLQLQPNYYCPNIALYQESKLLDSRACGWVIQIFL
jgi:hypothetical protein